MPDIRVGCKWSQRLDGGVNGIPEWNRMKHIFEIKSTSLILSQKPHDFLELLEQDDILNQKVA